MFDCLSQELVITDGAWGTELQKRGLGPGESADLWNLSRPAEVEAVALSYLEAGSRVILTNTFRANPAALAEHGAAGAAVEINRRGAEIARKAATGSNVRVFGSIGPTGASLTAGTIDNDTVTHAFKVQAEALADGGADALLFETFSDVEEARLAVRAARSAGLPIVVSFVFGGGKNKTRTMTGVSPERVARAMAAEGVHAVGANCGADLETYVELSWRLRRASGLPVWIKPSAGLPSMESGRAVYNLAPETFASYLPAWRDAGASFVGGCCGTGPEFIRALARAVASIESH